MQCDFQISNTDKQQHNHHTQRIKAGQLFKPNAAHTRFKTYGTQAATHCTNKPRQGQSREHKMRRVLHKYTETYTQCHINTVQHAAYIKPRGVLLVVVHVFEREGSKLALHRHDVVSGVTVGKVFWKG